MAPKVVFLMTDYGNDPTETATPYTIFKEAGFEISFATESGAVPRCDARMLTGWTGKLLGAPKTALDRHAAMLTTPVYNSPLAWTAPDFDLKSFDLIFLPGGHDKGMQQIITCASLHRQLASYMPLTRRRDSSTPKVAAAICHGVQVLATADAADGSGKSVIHDFETTSLTSFMENSAFWGTRLFLGDYYKTFGAGTDNVETSVRKRLDNPDTQYKGSASMGAFVHEDPNHYYLSGRFPGDAQRLAERTVELVHQVQKA